MGITNNSPFILDLTCLLIGVIIISFSIIMDCLSSCVRDIANAHDFDFLLDQDTFAEKPKALLPSQLRQMKKRLKSMVTDATSLQIFHTPYEIECSDKHFIEKEILELLPPNPLGRIHCPECRGEIRSYLFSRDKAEQVAIYLQLYPEDAQEQYQPASW